VRDGEVYLSGLVLTRRRVLVAGGGRVAARRVPTLLEAGALVHVVAPALSPELTALVDTGRIEWSQRVVGEADCDGVWFVMALTDQPEVNAMLAAAAEQLRIFCVRADAAEGGTAWTPATGTVGDTRVGVVSRQGPRAAARARDVALWSLAGDPDVDAPAGWVTLVGGGPGDAGLLTEAGRRAVRAADVVLYDRLAPLAVLAEAAQGAELIDVGKVPRGRHTPQETINEALVSHARAGRRVVRLKGGDSFVFGRGGEEVQACTAAGVRVRVVPGVSSALAAPALAGIPVTHRSLSQGFTVVSGHVPPGDPRSDVDWATLARSRTTLVILMGVANLDAICRTLQAGGLEQGTPAAVVADAGSAQMRVVRGRLDDIAASAAAAEIGPPAVTVIGSVAGLDLWNV
jgi:uroporphyrin-III C-methyltransferase / precorrin-2 dehydrogenase / sirohydrochlorin ferrochelatase